VTAPAFEFVEGATSDLAFVARGAGPEEVFAAAAEALLAATVEEPGAVAEREGHRLALEEPDLDLLLLRFLNELVFLRDARGLLLHPRRIRIDPGPEARLDAELWGERLDPTRHRVGTDVKAATAHGLRVAPCAGGWEACVTLDV
jgi:SHS2 domain-containing protein